MSNFRKRETKFLENHRHVLLLLASIFLFVMHCWADESLEPSLGLDISTTLFIGVLVFSLLGDKQNHQKAIISVSILFVLTSWSDHLFPLYRLQLLQAVLGSFVYASGSLLGTMALMRRKTSKYDDICSAISVYFCIGFSFAKLFEGLQIFHIGSFVARNGNVDRFSNLLYLSFSNLATVGANDITVVSSVGQSLSVIESIVGQFYIAVIVARLVAVYLRD